MKPAETAKTVSVLALAALAAHLLFGQRWLAWLAALLLALSLTDSRPARALAAAWLAFGEKLGRFNSFVILGAVFYLVLVPVAFLYRLFGGRSFSDFTADPGGSLFKDVPPSEYSRESFEKPW
jgi:hypothetical protein